MDQTMEAYCGVGICQFVLDRAELGEGVGEMWVLQEDGRILGSIAMLAEEGMGRLRWLLLHPDLRGRGAGKALVEVSLDYARRRGFPRRILDDGRRARCSAPSVPEGGLRADGQ